MIKIESHNVEFSDYTLEVISTIDNPIDRTFTPTVVFISGEVRIANQLPPQPYVNGTWTDEDVTESVENYLKTIEIK